MKGRVLFAAGAITAIGPGVARADEPTPEVVVEGARRVDRGTAVTVIDAARIDRLGTTSVGTTLEELPAVSGASGSRGERILSLRGFDQRQIAVSVDGVPVAVPYDGQLDLDKLPVDLVERVAVVKGASALLYGPNGLGGAIDIVTREPTERPSVRARTEAGVCGAARASLVGASRFGPVGGLVGASFESVRQVPMSARFTPTANEDGGARDNSDRLAGNLTTKWTWDAGDAHRVSVAASQLEGRYGVPPGTRAFTVRNWRWTDWTTQSVGASHAFRRGPVATEAAIYASRFANALDAYDDGRYATQRLRKAFHSLYDDGAIGGFVRTSWTTPLGAAREIVLRSWSGVRRDLHASQASTVDPWLHAATTLLTTSAEAEVTVLPRWLRASVGAELSGELPGAPETGPSPEASAGVGPMSAITFTPAAWIDVTASAASRTRFPTLRERFSTVFGARAPNPGLSPERAVNLAIDVAARPARWLRVAVGFFDSELRDVITTVFVAPGTDQLQNAARARFVGGEAELRLTPTPWIDVSAGWMVISARTGDGLADPLQYKPSDKGLVTLTVGPFAGVSATGVMRSVGGQDFQNPDTGRWGHLGGYRMFDARVDWAFLPGLSAWVRGTNLADANVEGQYAFPEPGRQLFVGLAAKAGS